MNKLFQDDEDNIIKRFQYKTPVDVVAIANEFGIEIFTSDFGGQPYAGKIEKKDGKYFIYVNVKDPYKRQRFTIAHELAHFILHKHLFENRALIDNELYRSGLNNEYETEANKLAADILMPWHLINSAMNENIRTIPELAKRFQVSDSAMAIRLGIPY
jgi:Zn-dependent peptidase ImmA (M78 family)